MRARTVVAVCAAAASLSAARLAADAAADLQSAPPPAELPERANGPRRPFDARALYASASPAVAFIMASAPNGSAEIGTGSLVDARGRVLTNAHVVVERSSGKPWPLVRVYFKPPRMTGDAKRDLASPRQARVAEFDLALDLALLEVEDPPAAEPLLLGDPPGAAIGDPVAAIGHPENGGLWTLTSGVISTVMADVGGVRGKHAFQTDVSINRGNSGGPLLDAGGRIIGINTLMSRQAADGLAITGVNFAVRSDVARWWLAREGINLASSDGSTSGFAAEEPRQARAAGASPDRKPGDSPKPAAPAKAAKRVTITEGKPYSADELTRANAKKAFDDLEKEEDLPRE